MQKAPETGIDFEFLAAQLSPLGNPKRLHLLHFLRRPHYLEEVASELGLARYAAQRHLEQLLDIGVVQKTAGHRETGAVTDYLLVPQRLFSISEEFAKLGSFRVDAPVSKDVRLVTRDVEAAPSAPVARKTRGAALVLVHGREPGTRFPLAGQGPWTIGRDAGQTVVLDYDPFASGRHAELRLKGGFELVDAFSRNGTTLNGEPIPRGEPVPVEAGDVVGVGKSLLVVQGKV